MSIWSNQSSVQRPFTNHYSTLGTGFSYGSIPQWAITVGTRPGSNPVVPPLGVTARLNSTAKPTYDDMSNALYQISNS
jgi:hypothetical protein